MYKFKICPKCDGEQIRLPLNDFVSYPDTKPCKNCGGQITVVLIPDIGTYAKRR